MKIGDLNVTWNTIEALADAITQYVQNTEDIEDLPERQGGLSPKGKIMLNEARKIQLELDKLFIRFER